MKLFITSDVHSFFSIMKEALFSKGFEIDNPEHYLIICGDLFDRGNESKQLLDFVKELGDRFVYIRGNHEDLLMDCVRDIAAGRTIGFHHFSNGTVKTIEQLCDLKENELCFPRRSDSTNQLVYDKMKPIMEWVNTKSVNYAEIGDIIFVHGWIPTIGDGIDFMGKWKNPRPAPRDWWDNGNEELWKEARWINGIDAWRQGCVIPGKTIVCGHWHCSWGWSIIRQKRKEFPDKSRKDWQKSFEPFVDDGIIAIDACTAYSGICNVIEMEVDVEDEDTSS